MVLLVIAYLLRLRTFGFAVWEDARSASPAPQSGVLPTPPNTRYE